MTLKSRNRLYFIFFILSVAVLVFCAAVFCVAAIRGNIVPPQNAVRTFVLFGGKKLFAENFHAVVVAIFALLVYVPVSAFIIFKSFEKTQSLEIIYFAGFLLGCLAEGFRIFVPVSGLWRGFSATLMVSGQSVIAGRILCPLSMLAASLFAENDQRQNVERNFIAIVICSVFAGIAYPFDSTLTTSTCAVLWSFRPLFTTLRVLVFAATVSVMLINAVTKGSRELSEMAVGYSLLFAGYGMLCVADCFVLAVAGIVLLAAGTWAYLRSTHKIYMWH